MIIKVKNCRNCPFASVDYEGEKSNDAFLFADCLHPSEKKEKLNIDSYWKNYKTPNWCPLKSEPLHIYHEIKN